MAINKVGSKGIVDCSVAAADFAPGTVTSVKLADDAVTNAKLSNSSITASGTSVALGASITLNNAFIDWQSKVTSDGSTVTTMVAGRGYFVDNSSAAGIVKLPASASIGDKIVIKDYAGNFATNKLTIQRNGHNIQGVANDSQISTNRASVVLVYVDATKGWLYTDEHNVANLQLTTYISATGGTVTTSGNFKIHSFTGDGNFVVSTAGVGDGPSVVDYLVVAGGGGGGSAGVPCGPGNGSGGGGAGGFRESHSTPVSGPYTASPLATPTGITVTTTTYPVTVGGGSGLGSCSAGSNSVFSTITSAGGGHGGRRSGSPTKAGGNGGSGGGASTDGGVSCEVAGTGNTPPVSPPQGQPGGTNGGGGNGDNGDASGGGGGATEAGVNGNGPGRQSGRGGVGATTNITGSSVSYAGGGGAGGKASTPMANGAASPCGTGSAGGGNTAGTTNRGGGGGGSELAGADGGAGGSGIVIIRYKFQ
jgi:hypothetical protein